MGDRLHRLSSHPASALQLRGDADVVTVLHMVPVPTTPYFTFPRWILPANATVDVLAGGKVQSNMLTDIYQEHEGGHAEESLYASLRQEGALVKIGHRAILPTTSSLNRRDMVASWTYCIYDPIPKLYVRVGFDTITEIPLFLQIVEPYTLPQQFWLMPPFEVGEERVVLNPERQPDRVLQLVKLKWSENQGRNGDLQAVFDNDVCQLYTSTILYTDLVEFEVSALRDAGFPSLIPEPTHIIYENVDGDTPCIAQVVEVVRYEHPVFLGNSMEIIPYQAICFLLNDETSWKVTLAMPRTFYNNDGAVLHIKNPVRVCTPNDV